MSRPLAAAARNVRTGPLRIWPDRAICRGRVILARLGDAAAVRRRILLVWSAHVQVRVQATRPRSAIAEPERSDWLDADHDQLRASRARFVGNAEGMAVALGPISIGRSPGLAEEIYRFATTHASIRKENRTMTWLLLNLLLAAPFLAIWVGVPLWLVFKHPDQDHQPQAASGPAHSHRVEPLTPNSRSSPDAASTRPAQTGQARGHTALDSPAGRALHTTTAS